MTESTPITLRTSVKPHLKRIAVLRGTATACLGGLILVATGVFLKPDLLQLLGLPLWILGLLLIAMGLLPYRKLSRLEMHPDTIVIRPEDTLQYNVKGKKPVTIPLATIAKMEYIDISNGYGILLYLKDPKRTIFCPYFSQNSYEELRQYSLTQ
jgi:hypothetical protein